MLQLLLWNNLDASVNIGRVLSLISAPTFGCEHTLLLNLAVYIRNAGENDTKNPSKSGVNTELAPAPEDSRIWLHRCIHYGFAFYLANDNTVDMNSMERPRPSGIWCDSKCHTLTWSKAKECDWGWTLLPYFVLIGFGGVCILFQGNHYPNVFPPRASWDKNKWDPMALCALWRGVPDGRGVWLWVSSPSLHSVHPRDSRLVRSVVQAVIERDLFI